MSYTKVQPDNKKLSNTRYVWCYICSKYDCQVWNHAR